jgi:hypothetical protein
MNPKPFWLSRTLWFNVITGGLAILDQLTPVLPASVQAALPTVILVGNLILRWITDQPVKL